MRNARSRAAEDFVSGHAGRSTRWKGLLNSDPRRAVRALQLTGFSAESVEGDTAWDATYIVEALQDVSRSSQGDVWRRLVQAGVVSALCQCIVKFGQVAIQHDPAATPPSEEMIGQMHREVHSAWYGPLAIICCALVNCTLPPTPTEKRMVEDLRLHWRAVTDRIWNDPANSLTENGWAVLERAALAQIVMRVTCIDPSFLDIVVDPPDVTLAICMRNWIHATAREDCVINTSLLLPLLDPDHHLPSFWRTHFDAHPLPPTHTLLFAIFARSKDASAEGNSPEQISEAVVNAAARHLSMPTDAFGLPETFLELDFLRTLMENGTKGPCPALPRAAYKSAPLWSGTTHAIRRAAREKARRRQDNNVFILSLNILSATLQPIQEGDAEYADAMIHGWATAGLLDALDELLGVLIAEPSGPLNLTMIFYTIKACIPKLSPVTLAALRSQFPRPGMMFRLLISSTMTPEEDERHYAEFTSRQGFPRADNPMWKQGAWQTLDEVAVTVALPGECARRGCSRRAGGPMCGTKRCKGTRYCSKKCLQKDSEHREICSKGWLELVVERHRSEERVQRQTRSGMRLCCALTLTIPILAYGISFYLRGTGS
ncbi:hypothetical protein BV20DRAFT_1019186 [Pilatotrama ljubarskyi]|nr:hypothetical protein BV20DRAFT_1019186 [Pilatotrama ljubarskyi]